MKNVLTTTRMREFRLGFYLILAVGRLRMARIVQQPGSNIFSMWVK